MSDEHVMEMVASEDLSRIAPFPNEYTRPPEMKLWTRFLRDFERVSLDAWECLGMIGLGHPGLLYKLCVRHTERGRWVQFKYMPWQKWADPVRELRSGHRLHERKCWPGVYFPAENIVHGSPEVLRGLRAWSKRECLVKVLAMFQGALPPPSPERAAMVEPWVY